MLSWPPRLALTAVALLVPASIVACRSKSPPAPAPAPSASSSSRADLFASPGDLDLPAGFDEGDAGPGGAMGGGGASGEPDRGLAIALVDAGAEPRAPLTYDLAAGKPQTVVLSFVTTVKEEGTPSAGAGDLPPLRLTLSVARGDKASPDEMLLQARVTKVDLAPGAKGVPPEVAAQLGELSKGLGALGATFAVSKRGVVEDAALTGDPEAQAAASGFLSVIEDALELFFVPMPEEPIGVGAQWTVTSPAPPGTPGGVVQKTYRLKARTPTTASVQEEQHEEAPEQPIGDPRAPPGATIAVVTKEASTLDVRLTGVASKVTSDEETVMTTKDPTTTPPKVSVTRVKRSVRLEAR